MLLTANARIDPLVRIGRNPSKIETGLVTPFVRVLRLPRPVDPATSRLPRCQICMSLASRGDEQRVLTSDLCLPKLAQEGFIIVTEVLSVPRPWRAISDLRRPRERTIIASTGTTAIQVLSTVCKGGCPFAYHRPKMEARILRALRASCCNVLIPGHREFASTEDLIFMHIDHNSREGWPGHEVRPVRQPLECVVKDLYERPLLGRSEGIANIAITIS